MPADPAATGRISRLRLGLALWFGVAFLVALAALDVGLLAWLDHQAGHRLDSALEASARGIARNIEREVAREHGGLRAATAEVLGEWPADPSFVAVFDAHGAVVGTRGTGVDALVPTDPGPAPRPWERAGPTGDAVRLVAAPGTTGGTAFRVVAGSSTASLRDLEHSLANWLLLSAPLVLLAALGAGYVLAARSLRPLRETSRAIRGVDPNDLAGRLPVHDPPDEIDVLSGQFNGLLDRLDDARARNRRFIARAAHQIRTPLTVARGEASLALEGTRSPDELRASLARIQAATELMSSRVDDLFLLAEAETTRPGIDDLLELDGLALECTDLMRGRASRTRHPLELDRVDACEARGSAHLLREALVELIENALRHSEDGAAVRVSAWLERGTAALEVASRGRPASVGGPRPGGDRAGGLGLDIVRWIAEVHGGRLEHEAVAGENRFRLAWPAAAT